MTEEHGRWVDELNAAVRTIARAGPIVAFGPVIDAAVLYNLGMTPVEAARVVLGVDVAGYKRATDELKLAGVAE